MSIPRFEVLFDSASRRRVPKNPLLAAYGGELTFARAHDSAPYVVANFVSTIDGVVALGGSHEGAAPALHPSAPADRLLMALLRTCADAVMIGAGTLRASGRHWWTIDGTVPEYREALHSLRRQRFDAAIVPEPTLVIVSASGDLPDAHVALREPRVPTVVLTTERGFGTARQRVDTSVRVIVLEGDNNIAVPTLMHALAHDVRARVVLSEAGPQLFGQFLAARCVDELFLTVAPFVAGGGATDHPSIGFAAGLAALPPALPVSSLRSVRKAGDHLFLRYLVRR